MAIDAERLYQASQIEPADLGADIVDPDDTLETQRQVALDWLDANVLPIADAEVSVPLLKTAGFDTIPGFINGRFPSVPELTRSGWIVKGEALYDGAVLSYGRSEINKSIDSNSKDYDSDSDQDRIQGNQRLQKLLEWAAVLIATSGGGGGTGGENAGSAGDSIPPSQSVRVRRKW